MAYNGIMNAGGGKAWGDIFTVNTPYIDNVGKQIYAQEQQRQLSQQRENDRLDQEFSKSVANIRDTDVNEYADKYQAWKQAKIGLMKMNPSTNQKGYIAAQLDANKKLADMSQFGNQSIATKAALLANGKAITADKNGDYKEDASNLLIKANQTPTSKLNSLTYTDDNGKETPYNPLDLESYKYQGNTTKWQPILQKATGTPTLKSTTTPVPLTDKNGKVLGQSTTEIKAVNSPLDYYTQLTGSLSGSKAAGNLKASFPFTDDQAQQIVEQYNDKVLNNPTAKAAWGDQGVKLPTNALLTPATRTVALMAMQHALTHPPEESAPKQTINPVAKIDKTEDFAMQKMHAQDLITQGHIRLAAGLKNDKESNDAATSADAVLHNMHDIISAGKPIESADNPWGMSKNVVEISDPNILKTFSGIVKDGTTPIPADNIYFNKETNQGILNYKMSDGTVKQIPISGADMVKAKAGETYKGSNAGKVVDVIDKVVTKNGGLTNTLKMYDPNQKTVAPVSNSGGQVKVQINGKIYQVPKSNLSKMDNDKVPYKVIQ